MSEALKSTRNDDKKFEHIVQKHFNLFYRINDFSFERTEDTQRQKLGEDLVIHTNTKDVIIDEKCATKYWDKPLYTFCFEVSSCHCQRNTGEATGKRYDGWFINEENQTQFYNIGYVRAENIEQFIQGNLQSFECMLISKKKLTKYILQKTKHNNIKDIENKFLDKIKNGEIIINENTGRYQWFLAKGIKIVMSSNLAECPINVIIGKDILSELAYKHGKIEYNNKTSFTYAEQMPFIKNTKYNS